MVGSLEQVADILEPNVAREIQGLAVPVMDMLATDEDWTAIVAISAL